MYSKLADIVYYAKKIGFPYVYITTNGSLCDSEKINPIIDAGIDSIRFSINGGREGYKEMHGVDAYDCVIANIRNVGKYKQLGKNINLSVSFVETKVNAGEIEDLRKSLKGFVEEIAVFKAKDLSYISDDVYT